MSKRTQLGPGLAIAGYDRLAEPVLLFDGAKRTIVWANNAAERWLGSECRGKSPRVDRSMPALTRLVEMARFDLPESGRTVTLVFWTRRGAQSVPCRCIPIKGPNGESLILVQSAKAVSPTQFGSEVGLPAAANDAPEPVHSAPRTPTDADTLREIARQIRAGYRRAAETSEADEPPFNELKKNEVPAPAISAPSATEEQEQAKILATISHEVRTPLNAVIGFAELLNAEKLAPLGHEKYRGYVADILQSARHAQSLVSDILYISRIRASGLDLSPAEIVLPEVVEAAVSALRPIADKAGVLLETSIAKNLPLVIADRRSLMQILLNLISNAIKYNKPGGRVLVSAEIAAKGGIALHIADTGPGMSEEEISATAIPFRRVRPNSAKESGAGIGLVLSRTLAEANGGQLEIRSETGKGTTVDVAFPESRTIPV